MLKQCRRCYRVKPVGDFCRSSRQGDGYQTWCKSCINCYKIERREQRRTPKQQAEYERQQRNKEYAKQGLKECSKCGIVKSLFEYWRGGTGVITETRGCCAECQQSWARENRKPRFSPPSLQRKAARAVFGAIQCGDITRPRHCPICGMEPIKRKNGIERMQFHHTDGYDEGDWFVGIFVCASCHAHIHLKEVEMEGKHWL